MNGENAAAALQDSPLLAALRNQLDILLLTLERPVVQRQIGAFLLVLFCAWLVPLLSRRTLDAIAHRRRSGKIVTLPSRWESWQEGLARTALALGYTLFPLLGLLFGHLTAMLFRWWDWPSGLIVRSLPLFWLLLVYRILVGLIYAFFERKHASRYHTRLLAPVTTILVIVILHTTLAGALPVGELTLVTLLDTPVRITALFSAIVIFYLFCITAWIVGGLLKRLVATTSATGQGSANTTLSFSRYAIIGLGALTAVSVLGFNLSALTIIGGGLSVGIGFGLQELVANFVSGILLLFESTVRPGTVVEVNGHRGVIDQLRMRATVVRTDGNTEVFIPNKNLLTSIMTTYTPTTNSMIQRVLPVGVSYRSNPTLVRDILLEVAGRHGVVLKNPAPSVFFLGFGTSRLEFELAIWVDDPGHAARVTSDLYFMIWNEFEKQQIEIPFPQQDLHLRSGPWPQVLAPPSAPHVNGESAVTRYDSEPVQQERHSPVP